MRQTNTGLLNLHNRKYHETTTWGRNLIEKGEKEVSTALQGVIDDKARKLEVLAQKPEVLAGI